MFYLLLSVRLNYVLGTNGEGKEREGGVGERWDGDGGKIDTTKFHYPESPMLLNDSLLNNGKGREGKIVFFNPKLNKYKSLAL